MLIRCLSCDIATGTPRTNQVNGVESIPTYYPINETAARRAEEMSILLFFKLKKCVLKKEKTADIIRKISRYK